MHRMPYLYIIFIGLFPQKSHIIGGSFAYAYTRTHIQSGQDAQDALSLYYLYRPLSTKEPYTWGIFCLRIHTHRERERERKKDRGTHTRKLSHTHTHTHTHQPTCTRGRKRRREGSEGGKYQPNCMRKKKFVPSLVFAHTIGLMF